MELVNLSGKPIKKVDNHVKKKTVKLKDTITEFIPDFVEDDKVTVINKFTKHSKHLETIKGLKLTVDYCKIADLGDMIVEVLYLKKTNELICNPYLVEHFKKV